MSTNLWRKLSSLLGKDVSVKALENMDDPSFDALLNKLSPEKKSGIVNLLAEAMQNPNLIFPKKLKASDFDNLPDPAMPKWHAAANTESNIGTELLEQKMPFLLFFVRGWHDVLFGEAVTSDQPIAQMLRVEIAQQNNASFTDIPAELNGVQSLIGAVAEVYGALPLDELHELVNLAEQQMQESAHKAGVDLRQQDFSILATPVSLATNLVHGKFVDVYRRKIHRAVNWRPAQMPTQADFDQLDQPDYLLVA